MIYLFVHTQILTLSVSQHEREEEREVSTRHVQYLSQTS